MFQIWLIRKHFLIFGSQFIILLLAWESKPSALAYYIKWLSITLLCTDFHTGLVWSVYFPTINVFFSIFKNILTHTQVCLGFTPGSGFRDHSMCLSQGVVWSARGARDQTRSATCKNHTYCSVFSILNFLLLNLPKIQMIKSGFLCTIDFHESLNSHQKW